MAQGVPNDLKLNIMNEFNKAGGHFALAFCELKPNGLQLLINEKENFHAASTMKTPVMIEVFKQAEQGKFKLDDSILIKNEFRSIVDSSAYSLSISDDAGEELYQFMNQKKTIRELVYYMIMVSSNLATNLLIDLVGAQNVAQTMKGLGANDIKVLRGVEDIKAFDLGLNNTTTAYDLMTIYKKIAGGEAVSKNASEEMTEILLQQKFNTIIPAKLPIDVKVAHKTGSITGVEHDSGIVFLPDGRKYVLVILSKSLDDNKKGIEAGANVSKIIYDYLTR